MIDNRPLKVKALEQAIKDILSAKDRDEANSRYKKWEVFKDDPSFNKVIKQKQSQFKNDRAG